MQFYIRNRYKNGDSYSNNIKGIKSAIDINIIMLILMLLTSVIDRKIDVVLVCNYDLYVINAIKNRINNKASGLRF